VNGNCRGSPKNCKTVDREILTKRGVNRRARIGRGKNYIRRRIWCGSSTSRSRCIGIPVGDAAIVRVPGVALVAFPIECGGRTHGQKFSGAAKTERVGEPATRSCAEAEIAAAVG